MALMGEAGMFINAVLMMLNLVPLPPLDGGRIAVSLLPQPYSHALARIEPFGFLIVILLMVTGVLNVLVAPAINFALREVSRIFGV